MDNKSKSHKSEQTKLRIQDSYLSLIELDKWDKISVKQICEHTGITRGTFYQYYNDIYDLMEQIETPLLAEIARKYKTAVKKKNKPYLPENFETAFDYAPPKILLVWFDFCQLHKRDMSILLSPNGDPYFMSKLKIILKEQIGIMMDNDSMPSDELRTHFSKIFMELHFLAAKTWLSSDEDNFLPIESIINLLNTMRVGANYLTYRRLTSPDFDIKMQIPKDI